MSSSTPWAESSPYERYRSPVSKAYTNTLSILFTILCFSLYHTSVHAIPVGLEINIPATLQARSAIIFLHGLGESAEVWQDLPDRLRATGHLNSLENTNFVFPNAPEILVTGNGGRRMQGWFDITLFSPMRLDTSQVIAATALVRQLIREQVMDHGIPPNRIVIAGFSQGAAVAMTTFALLNIEIGGVVLFSGFNPIPDTLERIYNRCGANFGTPVFQGHGQQDPIISLPTAQNIETFYKRLGFKNWTLHTYPGLAHATNEEELSDAARFLAPILESGRKMQGCY